MSAKIAELNEKHAVLVIHSKAQSTLSLTSMVAKTWEIFSMWWKNSLKFPYCRSYSSRSICFTIKKRQRKFLKRYVLIRNK